MARHRKASQDGKRKFWRNCEECGQRDYCHEDKDDGIMKCAECRESVSRANQSPCDDCGEPVKHCICIELEAAYRRATNAMRKYQPTARAAAALRIQPPMALDDPVCRHCGKMIDPETDGACSRCY